MATEIDFKVKNGLVVGTNATITNTLNSANLAYTGTLTGGTGVLAIGTNQIYKDASGNVGIGTSNPTGPLTIASSATVAAGNPSLIMFGSNNTERISIFSSVQPCIIGNGFQGTYAVPVAVGSTNTLIDIQGRGHDGATYGIGGRIQAIPEATWTTISHPATLVFSTTASGSTTNTERLRLTSAGGVSFGSSGTAYGTSGQVLTSAGNAAPTWTTPTTGTVTSVATSGNVSGITLTGGTITGSGTITLGGAIGTLNQNTTGSSASCTGNAATATNVAYSGLTGTVPTWNQNTTGNAATATSADNIDGIAFKNSNSSSAFAVDTQATNGIGYSTGYSLFGQTDGGVYCSTHDASWQHQINGDFRTGQIAVRGKNAGTWQTWRAVLDAGNYTSYSPTLTGGGASGSWGISVTGSSTSCTGNAATVTNGVYQNTTPTLTGLSFGAHNPHVRIRHLDGKAPGTDTDEILYLNYSNGHAVTVNGYTVIHAGNIGSQSVNYATTAGTATNQSGGTVSATTGAFSGSLSGNGNIYINNGSPTLYFQDTDQMCAMLHTNGNTFHVLRGGVNTTAWATVNGYWPLTINLSNNDITCGGNLTAVSNITAYASDKRLKENIVEIPNAIEKIKKIRGVTFDWNDVSEANGFRPQQKYNDIGVIAQEIEEVLPQVVTLAPFDTWQPNPDIDYSDEELAEKTGTSKSGENYKTVQYDRIVPLLIQAIKEQQVQIDELKQIINKGN